LWRRPRPNLGCGKKKKKKKALSSIDKKFSKPSHPMGTGGTYPRGKAAVA
jgi:hypothetical protein